MTNRKPRGQTWTSFVEESIQEAIRAGDFDHLPGFGQPLHFDDDHDENWWIKRKLKQERLSCLPPALAIRVDREKTLERIGGLHDESAVRREVAELNGRIRQANLRAVWGPPATTQPLDVEAVIADWRSAGERQRTERCDRIMRSGDGC